MTDAVDMALGKFSHPVAIAKSYFFTLQSYSPTYSSGSEHKFWLLFSFTFSRNLFHSLKLFLVNKLVTFDDIKIDESFERMLTYVLS